ncbi:MAG: tRNA uridine-5-carboxymethylaminomethyl(34) synthesis enzyme MnmG [Gammaproteobacteria bacterium TMED78]|nr:MAG: tRNA uridine-5-carboxymethylaminomethyl(34) synthesis enzyme MnmG [Gammaproteobacteria bacterium TMED78]
MLKNFDCIVIGGGHAGTEAALAAARLGVETLLLTQKLDTLGQMSCNPAIGGIGKGHLAKEIDALGGVLAKAADHAGIHFRTLNGSKGPAVRATRAQTDRSLYKKAIQHQLHLQSNLTLIEQSVDDLIIDHERAVGVITEEGVKFLAPAIILTVGTFLKGQIHIGDKRSSGGRAGDPPSNKLAYKLRDIGLNVSRLKTGTPPRIDGRSLNFSAMKKQPGDLPTPVFSFLGKLKDHPKQIACYISNTTERTHQIIRDNLSSSAMYSGAIEGVGPRYCPSIEDKVVRFSTKNSHQIFVEPEGLNTNIIYPNGISTSLPANIQEMFVKSIIGFENAKITSPGYAIEYDFFDPRDLNSSLESKKIKGLFFAGQINGTTGYEEAAAQGILAGLNAANLALDKDPWCPRRDQAYIGVLIDDLITLGTTEPYRMFTSRAEYRLSLREDNADIRLTGIGRDLGLVKENRWKVFSSKIEALDKKTNELKNIIITPANLRVSGSNEISKRNIKGIDFLKRPGASYDDIVSMGLIKDLNEGLYPELASQIKSQLKIQAGYSGYIERQNKEIQRQQKRMSTKIPSTVSFSEIKGLSNEVREKLEKVSPKDIGQASRISGVTPAAIALILIYLKKNDLKRSA